MILTLCMLGHFHNFLSSADFFSSKLTFSKMFVENEISAECPVCVLCCCFTSLSTFFQSCMSECFPNGTVAEDNLVSCSRPQHNAVLMMWLKPANLLSSGSVV